MTSLSYEIDAARPAQLGLVVLQADETIERDFRRLMPETPEVFVTRIPSGEDLNLATLAAMEEHLTAAAALFPRAADFAAVAYGCTSASALIGAGPVAGAIHAGTRTAHVTEPLTALIAACRALGVTRLAMLSPYLPPVSSRLREALAAQGISTVSFGSFDEEVEARVVRIAADSVHDAALELGRHPDAQALFLSCTNLRTLGVIPRLEAALDIPVLSSNQVLAWDLLRLAGLSAPAGAPGRLFACEGP
ncbi:maleate cis-trans isomerase family protein [Roseisalinus antarcticus]|uniref:Arylmalonate decarboxylase n=1 Tax=Roseisalinus antarcticus TaxID=254357 RepID=A0A1Y5SEG6_9RHOB|nr:aspartate/glutamate racemase family protein [Roseisalinus antarcticus]SLN37315.1 Arylmalonate decarboxylase [Roseisalinus antarcticus]